MSNIYKRLYTFRSIYFVKRDEGIKKLFLKKKEKEKREKRKRTRLKDLGRETRRDEIKLIRIKLTPKSIDLVSILKSFSPQIERRATEAKIIQRFDPSWNYWRESSRDNLAWIEFFIANCSRVASFKG